MSKEVPYSKYKNSDWQLHEVTSNSVTPEDARLAVLMDIRGELQKLNRLLSCPNFTSIPQVLKEIRRNTTKPKRRKK